MQPSEAVTERQSHLDYPKAPSSLRSQSAAADTSDLGRGRPMGARAAKGAPVHAGSIMTAIGHANGVGFLLLIWISLVCVSSFGQGAPSYRNGVAMLPVVRIDQQLYSASLTLQRNDPSEFGVNGMTSLGSVDGSTARDMVAYFDGLLSIPSIQVDTTKYRAVLTLTAQNPVALRLSGLQQIRQDQDLAYEYFTSRLNPWNYTLTTADRYLIKAGSVAERFELRVGDSGPGDSQRTPPFERSEVAEGPATRLRQGDVAWYSFSFFAPPEYQDDQEWTSGDAYPGLSLIQFQQSPNYDPAWMFVKTWGGDFILRKSPTRPDLRQAFTVVAKSDFAGTWINLVISAKWSTGADGYMNVWVNDVQAVSYKGPTRTAENDSIYLKYGLYRGSGSSGRVSVVFDNVRRAKSREELN